MLTDRTHVAHITKLSIPNNICEAYVVQVQLQICFITLQNFIVIALCQTKRSLQAI